MNIIVRQVDETDLPFIFSTWLKGLYHGNELYGKTNQDLFYSKYHKVIEALLKVSEVKIACLQDEPDVVLGYSVALGNTLHWVFVKKAWRKLGISKSLVNPTITTVSHLTKVGESIAKKKDWTFNPFLF